jgi:3-carboxy-cis,cis-muconate cycloisomerase
VSAEALALPGISPPDSPALSREPFGLLMHVFGDPEVAEILSGDRLIESWLEAERALALAEAEVGLIEASDAEAVAKAATLAAIDREVLWEKTRLVGYPILPLVRMIAATLPEGPDGRVHYGATTQDIMDTGLALQLVRVLERLDDLVVELGEELAQLVGEHRDTAMAARTHGQQAVPTTFGAKLASFLGEFARHRERLASARRRVAVVSLYGAGGTSAALGADAARLRACFARRLGLGVCETSWHAARDALGEFGMLCAMLSASAARFGNEVINLSRSEIAEVSEGGDHHYGASSTMPQKRNPIRSEVVVGTSIVASALAGALGRTMVVPHERAAGEWQAEWQLLPELASLAAAALSNSSHVARHLSVHPETMRANLEADGGRMLAEAFMIGLSVSMGREAAHDLVYEAAHEIREGHDLLACLRGLVPAEQSALLETVAASTSYDQYLGEAGPMCDRALAEWREATVDRKEADRQ